MNNLRRIIREALQYEIGNEGLDRIASKASAGIVNYANTVIAGIANRDQNILPPLYDGGTEYKPLLRCRACPSYTIKNNRRAITIGDYPIAYILYRRNGVYGISDIDSSNPEMFNLANGISEDFKDKLYDSIITVLNTILKEKTEEYNREKQYNLDLAQQAHDYYQNKRRVSRKPKLR